MIDFSVEKRAVLLLPSPSATSAYGLKHPYIVVTNPCDMTNFPIQSIMMVSVSSIKIGLLHDATCVLEPGCHPAITKHSAVQYGKWSVSQKQHIETCVQNGTFIPHSPMSVEITESIVLGIFKSPFTPPWVKSAYTEATSG